MDCFILGYKSEIDSLPFYIYLCRVRKNAPGAYGITFATVFQNSKLAKDLEPLARYSCGS